MHKGRGSCKFTGLARLQ